MAHAGDQSSGSESMESVLHEHRHFPPSAEISQQAHIQSQQQYEALHRRSLEDPDGFWGEQAAALHWFEKWDRVLEWNLPDAKWFIGGKLNACYNCVDRHVDEGFGEETAVVWEGEPQADGPEIRKLTYRDLQRETARFANVLKRYGVQRGDVVTLYMPMVPELMIAMLGCARIGAPHSIIFGGFSAGAIRDRVEDAQSKLVVTADGGWRRGKPLALKNTVDEACELTDCIEHVITVQRCGNEVSMQGGRDAWWHEQMQQVSDDCPCEAMDSEDLLFILYTSGTTGKPKGIMHTTGGYLVQTYLTARYVFDLHEDDPNELYWCSADIGWITGHSYITYGILSNRVPTLMYEGAPNYPDNDRFWDIIERHRVTKFYTAPTAIRAFMKWGDHYVDDHDLSSLKILGTVGEPINPEAWMWYHKHIGSDRCPIVDTWWQTETGGHMITPLPGASTCVPGSVGKPFLGVDAAVVDEEGQPCEANQGGLLVIRQPWPGMMRGIYGDRQRFIDTYWSTIEGCYLAGDSARQDEEGNFWIMGRIDDVINVAGHRLGTAEVESALVSHDAVAEAAVVGMPDEIKGTGIAAFVTIRADWHGNLHNGFKDDLTKHVADEIGSLAKPSQIRLTDALPKTRSGKIMRRLLREIAEGHEVQGDTTTLEDFSVLAKLRESE
jgi:acetyl-CoA synthetase